MSSSEGPHDTPDGDVATREGELRTVRGTYRRLRIVGLTDAEAGNLTARLNGLAVAEHSWTPGEIERLLFLRALVELHRIS